MNVTKAQVEAAAAAVGLTLGPQDGCGGWTQTYKPHVQWPRDYSEKEQTRLRNAAIAALSAVMPAQDGWRLVPAEADKNMVAAGEAALIHAYDRLAVEGLQELWREMLAAAPTLPTTQGQP